MIGAPSAASIRSVWSRLGAGSDDLGGAVGLQPGEQQRGLHLRARDRQARGAAPTRPPPRTMSGGSVPSARPSSVRTHRPAAARRPGAIGRSRQRRRRRSAPRGTGGPASRPAQQADRRAGVAAVDDARRFGERRRPRARRRSTADPAMLHPRPPARASARTGAARRRRHRPRPATRDRPSAMAANSSARCEMPLSPGTRSRPRSGAGRRGPARSARSHRDAHASGVRDTW